MAFKTPFEAYHDEDVDAPPDAMQRRRLGVLGLLFICLFGYIAYGLVRVHTRPDERLIKEDKLHEAVGVTLEPRGEIRDRNGKLLAIDRRVDSLWAIPGTFEDPYAAAAYFGPIFGVDQDLLVSRLSPGNTNQFAYIRRWLSDEQFERYKKLDPKWKAGVALKKEWVRYYPEGSLASHVLGFVNVSGQGRAGIELAYDEALRSTPGTRRSRVDARRRLLDSLTLEYIEPQGADHVYLTIDKSIQRSLENRLDQALEECKAPSGMGIIVDPYTGAIRALACRPAFDPNEFRNVDPTDYKNRALVDVFEPGSVFKVVTFAAAIELGLITPDTLIDCENGYFNPYGHGLRDFHKLGVVPVRESFIESSNIATVKIAAMLGEERMEKWIRRFGFGRRACQDVRSESRGIFRPRSQWSKLSMGAIPIGQEIAVTLPQLARAFCILANGGMFVYPYLVEQVVDRDGSVTYQHETRPPERILSEATAATMREMAHGVCLSGTGTRASIAEYRTGGKTGTAQIARPDGRGYYADKYTAVFAGFAPVGAPRLVGVIVVQEPAIRLHYGGYVCGPVFKDVIREALISMGCPQDPVTEEIAKAAAEADDADTVAVAVAEHGTAADGGDMEILEPLEPNDILEGLALVGLGEIVSPDEPRLGDLAGLTKRQAKAYLDVLGLGWDPLGAGKVISQYPPAGTPLREVSSCRLVFSSASLDETYETQRNPQPDQL